MSNKPVSIDPANASEDEAKPKVELVTKRQTITPVWKYFGLEANKKGKPRSPDRHMCQREVAAKVGNTSNLYSHLKNRHHDLYLQVERKRQEWGSMIVQQVSHHYQRHGKGCRHFRPVLKSTRNLLKP